MVFKQFVKQLSSSIPNHCILTESEKKISYKINKHGFEVLTNIKRSKIDLNPSIKQGQHKQNTKEIKTSLEDYEFVYEFKL